MRNDYRTWLEAEGYSGNTISTQCSHASRIEATYGNLDQHYATDRLEGVLRSLRYTSDDARRGSPNPSKVAVGGDIYKSLASFRSAVGLYRRFRDQTTDGPDETVPAETDRPLPVDRTRGTDTLTRERIGLERDLQKALRQRIEQLERGLVIIDEGVERVVPSGYIDITARDAEGVTVIIELKAGTADRAAVGQILSYMGDIVDEEATANVRGILIAHAFDARAKAAARMVPSLMLRSYAVQFSFRDPLRADQHD